MLEFLSYYLAIKFLKYRVAENFSKLPKFYLPIACSIWTKLKFGPKFT